MTVSAISVVLGAALGGKEVEQLLSQLPLNSLKKVLIVLTIM